MCAPCPPLKARTHCDVTSVDPSATRCSKRKGRTGTHVGCRGAHGGTSVERDGGRRGASRSTTAGEPGRPVFEAQPPVGVDGGQVTEVRTPRERAGRTAVDAGDAGERAPVAEHAFHQVALAQAVPAHQGGGDDRVGRAGQEAGAPQVALPGRVDVEDTGDGDGLLLPSGGLTGGTVEGCGHGAVLSGDGQEHETETTSWDEKTRRGNRGLRGGRVRASQRWEPHRGRRATVGKAVRGPIRRPTSRLGEEAEAKKVRR
ncbi:hypothetical protein SALBM217S_00159 [Streptomyces griseoloalbus]